MLALTALAQTSVQAASELPSRVERSRVTIKVPANAYQLTTYIRQADAQIIVHLQPRDSTVNDILIDARRGIIWSPEGDDLQRNFKRLGAEPMTLVAQGQTFDLQMLRQLGCAHPVRACTSPADADVLLFAGLSAANELQLDVVDLRPLFLQLASWLGGQASPGDRALSDSDWSLLKMAAMQPQRREEWLDAIRSIDTSDRWQRAYAAYSKDPQLASFGPFQELSLQAVLQGTPDDRVPLKAELELVGLRLRATQLIDDWERNESPDSFALLLDLLTFAGKGQGVQGRATGHVVDVLINRSISRQRRLTQALTTHALQRKSHLLWCNAEWVAGRACSNTPPWVSVARLTPPPAESAIPLTAPAPKTAARINEDFSTAGVHGIAAKSSPGSSGKMAGDALQELSLIRTLPNELVLLNFSESTGRLTNESGQLDGFSFVARSLGSLHEGRFELQMIPNGRAPVRLTHGAYRVKVSFVLDYTREDQCGSGLSCLFKTSQRHAKTDRRTVTFRVAAANQFRDSQACDFGHLMPLVADGGDRYRSVLKEARLSIEGARFELQ